MIAPSPDSRLSSTHAMSSLDSVSGTVTSILARNEETGWVLCRIAREDDPTLTTPVKGVLPGLAVGVTARFTGRWGVRNAVGRWEQNREGEAQFEATGIETHLPVTRHGVIAYISHQATFRGLGPKRAESLVEHFGVDVLATLHADPERVAEVFKPGKVRTLACAAFAADAKARESADLSARLQSHGFTSLQATKVIARFGVQKTEEYVRLNPYRLTEVRGLGFRTADSLALGMGRHPLDPARLAAGAVFALEEIMGQGDSATTRDELRKKMAVLLAPSTREKSTDRAVVLADDLLEASISDAVLRGRLVEDTTLLYLPDVRAMEIRVAEALAAGLQRPVRQPLAWQAQVEQRLAESLLSEEQREAVRLGVRSSLMVLTGGPGTGKTTTLKTLTAILQEVAGLSIALAAPTGKAAMRAQEATGLPATTIHRLLGGFRKDPHLPTPPIDADVVILDECSMIDLPLADWFFSAIDWRRTRVVLAGDVDQIPSVGHGEVFANVITAEAVPVARLTTVYRQAAASRIITNAHRIRRAQMPDLAEAAARTGGATDFYFRDLTVPEVDDFGNFTPITLEERSAMECAKGRDILLKALTRHYVANYGADPVRDVQVLAPARNGGLGVTQLNLVLRDALNPNGAQGPAVLGGYETRVGDKVIATRNNRDTGIFNGEMAVIVDVSPRSVTLDFSPFNPDRSDTVEYQGARLKELEPAWALTVHKTQGSEFRYVVGCWHTSHYVMLKRRLLYTMITRAKQEFVLLANLRALELTMREVGDVRRTTGLIARIQAVVARSGASAEAWQIAERVA